MKCILNQKQVWANFKQFEIFPLLTQAPNEMLTIDNRINILNHLRYTFKEN